MAATYPTSAASFPARINGNTIPPTDHNAPCDEIVAVESALLGGVSHWLKGQGVIVGAAVAQTIAAGVIAIQNGAQIVVDTQGASAADDLDTITVTAPTYGPTITDGAIVVLKPASAARVVTVKDGTGNLLLQGDCVFSEITDRLVLLYDGTNFIELARARRGWVSPAFSAGDYTGNGSMTVNVASGDVSSYRYKLDGDTMTVSVTLNTITIAGTPNTDVQIAIPAGKTASGAAGGVCWINNNGTESQGRMRVADGGTVILVNTIPQANWAAAANTTYIQGTITFRVS